MNRMSMINDKSTLVPKSKSKQQKALDGQNFSQDTILYLKQKGCVSQFDILALNKMFRKTFDLICNLNCDNNFRDKIVKYTDCYSLENQISITIFAPKLPV